MISHGRCFPHHGKCGQSTGNVPILPFLLQSAVKSHFGAILGHFGPILAKIAQKRPKSVADLWHPPLNQALYTPHFCT